jgi:hypothetical protein
MIHQQQRQAMLRIQGILHALITEKGHKVTVFLSLHSLIQVEIDNSVDSEQTMLIQKMMKMASQHRQ